MAEAEIAEPAEQAAHQIGDVAMIDAKLFRRPLPADCAQSVLAREQGVVLLGRNPVVIFQPGPAGGPRVVLALLAVGIGILGPFAPALGVDRVFVGDIKGAIGGKRAQSEVDTLRVAFFLALACDRHGTASLPLWARAEAPRAGQRLPGARIAASRAHARAAPQALRPAEIGARCLSGWVELMKMPARQGRRPACDRTFRSCLGYTRIVLHTQAQNAGEGRNSPRQTRPVGIRPIIQKDVVDSSDLSAARSHAPRRHKRSKKAWPANQD